MAEESEAYVWLKSLSPGIKLEKLSVPFESRGRSLACVKSEDLDSFFPSSNKLLLAERRVLETGLSSIKTERGRQSNLNHLEPKRLNMTPSTSSAPQQRSSEAAVKFWSERDHFKPKPSNDSKSVGPKSCGTVRKSIAARNAFPIDYRLVVVGELACLNDPESYTVGGLPPAGLTLAGRSKGRGKTKW